MKLSLPPELEQFVEEKVRTGQYSSANAVVEDGLRLLSQLSAWTDEELRKEIQIGLDQLDRGEGKTLNIDEIKAAVLKRHQARISR